MRASKFWLVFVFCVLHAGCTPPAPTPSQPPESQMNEIATAETRLKKAPNFDNYISLGLAYSRAAKHQEALEAYRAASRINPRAPVAYNNLCSEFTALKQWESGIENCQKALKLEPTFALASNNLAFLLKSKDAETAKIANYEENIRLGKDVDRSRLELGLTYYSQVNYDRAVQVWSAVPEGSPQFATVQNNLASVYIITKKFDLAKAHIDRALALDPKNTLYQNNLRWLQSAEKESERK